MSEIKLSVQDAVEQLLMSQSTIYSWIEKGFLQAEDTPAGRVIVISENELEQIRERNLKSKRNKVSKQITNKNTNEASQNVVDAEILNFYVQQLRLTEYKANELKRLFIYSNSIDFDFSVVKDIEMLLPRKNIVKLLRYIKRKDEILW